MAVLKLSQIALAGSPPASSDTVIGVGGGTTDLQYSLSQVASTVGGLISLSINTTPITGTTGKMLWDDTGLLAEVTVGSGLSFSGGTLTNTGGVPSTPLNSVQYDNAGSFGGAANFSIFSGQPIVPFGSSYLYGSSNYRAISAVSGGFFTDWFFGNAGPSGLGNTAQSNIGVGFSALSSLTTSFYNIGIGYSALSSLTTGAGGGSGAGANIAIGFQALQAGIDASFNVAIGNNAMTNFTTGTGNVAINGMNGNVAGASGSYNMGVGAGAMSNITTGSNNMAIGHNAMQADLSGQNNMAVGATTMQANTLGSDNTAIGQNALNANIDGNGNVAIGSQSLQSSLHDSYNISIGYASGGSLNGAGGNVFIGTSAGQSVSTGANNVLIGQNAGSHISSGPYNICVGLGSGGSFHTGTFNTLIGTNAGNSLTTSDSYNTIIGGAFGVAGQNNTLTIADGAGNLFITGDASRNITVTGWLRTSHVAVGSLPAAGNAGARSFVTDATATTFASVVAGGGANGVPVYDDGTNWRIG